MTRKLLVSILNQNPFVTKNVPRITVGHLITQGAPPGSALKVEDLSDQAKW
jgi:hypothetical protein